MNELPEPWYREHEMESFREVARKSGVSIETVRKVTLGWRRPTTATAQKLADAYGVDRRIIDEWCGVAGADTSAPYRVPDEAVRLTLRQRRALDEIIMAMIEPRAKAVEPADAVVDVEYTHDLAARHSMDEDRKNRS